MTDRIARTIIRALLTLAFVISLCPLLPVTPARAATINVPADYATIQAAVNAAAPGDTILIAPGVYQEQVVITTDNLTLAGTGTNSNPTVITVPPAGLTYYTTHIGDKVEYVVVAHDCQNTRLYNIFVLARYTAIGGINYYSNTVFDNVTGTTGGLDSCLISAWNSGPNFADVAVAISGSTVAVSNSDLEYFQATGLFIQGINIVTVSNSLLGGGPLSKGINDQGSTTGIIRGDEIRGCSFGINLANPTATWTITGSAVYNCTVGLYTTSYPLISVSGNLFYHNVTGIYDHSLNASVHCNAIMGNTTGLSLQVIGIHNYTGNYWGSNSGPNVDSGGPGTGDAIITNGYNALTYDPWAAMRITATPAAIPADGTSRTTVDLDMTRDNHGNPLGCTIPDGYPINFSTTFGTVSPSTVTTLNGHAVTSLTSSTTSGIATVRSSFQALPTLTLTTGTVTFTALPAPVQTMINTGQTSHGGSLPGVPTTQGPVSLPVVNVSAARLSSSSVEAGSPVTVTADVTNTGMVPGASLVKVYLNGELAGSKGVTVEAGKTTPVTFTVNPDKAGDYTVTVNGIQAGSFKVSGFNDLDLTFVIAFAAFVITIIALTAIYLRKRRTA